MTRVHIMLYALLLAGLTGWLFAAKVPPPDLSDLHFDAGLEVWIAVGVVAGLLGLFGASGRGNNG
jgi:hypothetical protein